MLFHCVKSISILYKKKIKSCLKLKLISNLNLQSFRPLLPVPHSFWYADSVHRADWICIHFLSSLRPNFIKCTAELVVVDNHPHQLALMSLVKTAAWERWREKKVAIDLDICFSHWLCLKWFAHGCLWILVRIQTFYVDALTVMHSSKDSSFQLQLVWLFPKHTPEQRCYMNRFLNCLCEFSNWCLCSEIIMASI